MRYFFFLFAFLLTACGQHTAAIPTIKPYKMDVQQGNVVTPKMMMQLRPGMTKSQVRFIMGTPLLVDAFHTDRWDYFYQMRKEGKIIEQRRVILEFEGDSLTRVRGDVVPAGSDPNAISVEPGKVEPRSIQPKKEEKGLLDKLKFWEGDEPAKPKTMPQPEAVAAPASAADPAEREASPVPAPLPVIAPRDEPTMLPPLTQPEPIAPAEAVQKPEPVKPAPAKVEETPRAEEAAKPAEEKPVEAPRKPVVQSEPKPEPKPEVKAKSAPKVEPKPEVRTEPKSVPKPPEDLPLEDSPDYFEKMLEKIGF
jgi:outer membrane protein assembly factor BamE